MLNFTFTVEETNLILGALGELPAKVTMGMIDKIRAQAQPQLADLPAPEEDAAEAE